MLNDIECKFYRQMKARSDLAPDRTENTASEMHHDHASRRLLQIRRVVVLCTTSNTSFIPRYLHPGAELLQELQKTD